MYYGNIIEIHLLKKLLGYKVVYIHTKYYTKQKKNVARKNVGAIPCTIVPKCVSKKY
jgi:hypothetical protein